MRIQLQASQGNFENLTDELWRMLREIQGGACFRSNAAGAWQPRINVYELDGGIAVCAELPGVSPDDLDVEYHQGILHIRGSRDKPFLTSEETAGDAAFEPRGVYLMEIDSGPFHRAIDVGAGIDADAITASFRQGYLWILLPRTRSTGTS